MRPRTASAQALANAERLITPWNERQARRMPLFFAPTIGAALAARYHFESIARPTATPPCEVSHSVDIVLLTPAECAVRRACAAVGDQHRPTKCARTTGVDA